MPNQKKFLSLKDWCIENNRRDFLDLWDYKLNDTTPEKTAHMSTKKVWLKCPRGIHESTYVVLQSIIKAYKKGKDYKYCKGCNSFGMYVVDNYGQEYLDAIWSDKNTVSPFEISQRGETRIWLRCLSDNTHPDYDLATSNFQNSHRCPYCAGKRVCETNSFGHLYHEYLHLWSDKNNKTPYDYTYGSNSEVWFKCPYGIHEDYKRDIAATVMYDFRCPICGKENQTILKGENHPSWKGGVTTEAEKLRKSKEYEQWRESVFMKDNYTCQCCGTYGGRLVAHHLLDYANNVSERFNVENGITLCFNCHDSTIKDSFHNLYGTHGKTPNELEEYINSRRKELGIPIPFSLEAYLNGNILTPGGVEWAKEYYANIKVRPDRGFKKILPKFRVTQE